MNRRQFITSLGGAATALPLAARAQQAAKVYRIGYLGVTSYAEYAREIERQGASESRRPRKSLRRRSIARLWPSLR
jgi:hypothetical protein